MVQRARFTKQDLYKIAKNQRRLVWVILCALLNYAALFGVVAMFTESDTRTGPTGLFVDAEAFHIVTNPESGLVFLALVGTPFLFFMILVVVWLIVFVLLLSSLRLNVFLKMLAILGSFVPIISLLVLLAVLLHASRVLSRAGYKAGLLGLNSRTVGHLKAEIKTA